ncbi:hypothetical protein IOQ59_20695 [Pontibacterium sp. N1Y112]|uniref:Uncharacterized protein n=1 Tax=Pontibacterium sinense TaxID=2781979 RepID=A0A8J7FXW6_9GAMM|nr:hypothetical protein [Pontibacterium sinense]MBE9399690.1 hypothetical protein [Pontibacterium sinense]
MRKFRRLSETESSSLNALFPCINELYAKEDLCGYKHLSISVFDHWLSQKEAIEEIDNVSSEKEDSNDRKLYDFCCALASKNECYLIKLLGRKKDVVTFREFSSQESRQKCLEPMAYNYGSHGRFVLVFPKMELIYFEDWDFTHHIYYKDPDKLEGLREQVDKYEIYILEPL